MTLTKRDRWIVLLLPVVTLLFFYGWFVFRPLNAKVKDLSSKVKSYGTDADGLSLRIAQAGRTLKEVKEERTKTLAKIAEEKKTISPDTVCVPEETSPDRRFQRVVSYLNNSGVVLLSAKRKNEGERENFGGLFDPSSMTRWDFHLQGTYPQILTFLQKNGESGWGIPVTADMKPTAEPGKAADWFFTIYL